MPEVLPEAEMAVRAGVKIPVKVTVQVKTAAKRLWEAGKAAAIQSKQETAEAAAAAEKARIKT